MMNFAAFLTLAISVAQAPPPEDIRHYVGTVTVSSPDGGIPYSVEQVTMKRVIDREKSRITEELVRPGVARTGTQFLVFSRVGDANEFSISGGGYTGGTVTVKGDEWAWSHWQYVLKLAGDATLEGMVVVDTDSIRGDRIARTVRGTAIYRQIDELRRVPEDIYRKATDELGAREPGSF